MTPKNYDQILFDILKPLTLSPHNIPIYLNTMPEEEEDEPDTFIVYRTGIVNSGKVYGDGLTLIRNCECDIIVSEYGTGNYPTSGTVVQLVEQLLIDNEIAYTKYTPGVEQKSNTLQTNFTFSLS